MIAASAVLVVAALVLLIVGVFQDGLELVFGSIASSIVAAIALFLGVLRDRREPTAVPSYPVHDGAPVGGIAVTPPPEEIERRPSLLDEEMPRPEEAPTLTGLTPEASLQEAPPLILPDEEDLRPAEPEAEAPAAPARSKPAAKKRAAKKSAGKKPTAKKPAARKSATKKPAAKKSATKKSAAKKTAAKKPAAKSSAGKKTAAKKPAAKRPAAKKTTKPPPSE